MSLTSISPSERAPDHLTTSQSPPVEISVPQPQVITQATGDKRLLALYASAIRQATRTKTGKESIEDIPNDSRFGAWWQQLFNATNSPVFLEWAKSKNIDTREAFTIDHLTDTLTVTINGRRTQLRGAEQGRGWREAIGPIMAAAKGVGNFSFDAPISARQAPLLLVARFYGEVLLPYRTEETLARATQLEHNQAFDVLGPDTYVDVGAQSPEILEQQKIQLGDSINRFTLLQKLKAFAQSRPELLNAYLEARMPLHPDSSYQQDSKLTDVSLIDLISANGWHVPENVDELNNLMKALAAPSLLASADGNFAGALAWPMPISVEDRAKLFHIIADNRPPLPCLDSNARLGTTDVVGALIKQLPGTVLEEGDAIATLQSILQSPQVQQLGEELKKRMGEVFENSTPREVLLTALAITLDVKGLTDPKPNHVAGFDLADPKFHHQPLSTIKQGLIDHLVQTHTVDQRAAPLAAMLLLSRVAPELCVPDTPSDITYMSANWVRLKAAVDRIEATNPGASLRTSFDELVDFDAIDPMTDHEQEIQALTAVPALVQWGKANGTVALQGEVSAEQLANTQKEFAQQEQQILSGAAALTASPPTQRSIALAELKAHFGDGIPFEEKSIRSHVVTTDSYKHTPVVTSDPTGSYSLLDLYLAKKAGLQVGWHSPNPKISQLIIAKVATLPDPITKHSGLFDDYANSVSQAWSTLTRKLISDLPLEDRKNIEWGELTVYQRGQTSRTEVSTPHGSVDYSNGFSSFEDDRSLIIETTRNGVKSYYELDPQRKVLRRRDDWQGAVHEGVEGPEVESSQGMYGKKYTKNTIRKLDVVEDHAISRGREDKTDYLPNSFSSDRSQHLGKLLAKNILAMYAMEDVKASLSEVTTFDQEEEKRTFMRNLVLGFIPGGSAIWNLAHGNYKDAAADIIFDVVMYATTAGLGKGAGAAKGIRAGKGLPALPKRFAASLTASNFGLGLEGAFRSTAYGGKKLISTGRQWFAKLRGSSDDINLLKLANKPDIAVGTYAPANGSQASKISAQFDEATGKWVPYDVALNKRYGKPLENFTPETARYFDGAAGVADDAGGVVRRIKKPNHLERSLATDNAMRLGSDIKDFKSLGDGIFTYVDKYKGVERLNVCAHGVNPNFKQLLSDEPMRMFYNNKHNSPDELLALLKASGINPESFNNVRLLMCHSANGSANSFGSQFGRLIKRDVKAFQGPVRAYVIPDTVERLKGDLNVMYPQATVAEINQKIYNQLQFNLGLGTNKVGPKTLSGSSNGREIPFFYRPVKFKAA